jgi:hypothetical protein
MYGIGARKTLKTPNMLKELNFKVHCQSDVAKLLNIFPYILYLKM